ncbi:unnamed protein product [Eruca vesicaria subsp. sativa]|uniref:Legume lectin domain-containing protein n=1 Tax=Eruca vesicaria subsp. sativa TaxID=29727 RepID=A0ABC8JM16_ERUVS|nr:unnamed protein product [Eruca vesicaria subsp. sativa]
MARGQLLQILIITSLNLISLSSQQETRFVYENFTSQENLHLDASAKVLLPSGLLQLTNNSDYQMGRAFHKKPIQFTSFSTHFVCALVPKPGVEPGHGLTFLVSASLDFSNAQATRYLGAFNASVTHAIAVELDTIWNPEFNDIKGGNGHVGIDVTNPISIAVAQPSYYSKGRNVSLSLLSRNSTQVWVDYDGSMLNVSLAPLDVKKPSLPLLSQRINFSDVFPNRSKLFVGFSAATGNAVSDQYILWWSFSTSKGGSSLQRLDISKLPQVPLPKPLPTVHPKAPHKKLPQWIIIMIVCVAVVVLAVLAGVYVHRRKKFSEVSETWEKEFDAHRFSYKSLYKATKGFSKDEFLGKGESRPTMEQVVLYLNQNLPLPDFSPYTLGIGTFAPVLVDAASLVVSSASWSWSAPSMSSSSANHSPYAYQATDQPWGQTLETKNSLHIAAESEKPKTQSFSSAVKTVTLPEEDLESNLSRISSQR